MKKLILALLTFAVLLSGSAFADNALKRYDSLKNAGLLLMNPQGQATISDHADKAFIPASTTKIVTAWLALNRWGENHRFHTHFFLDPATHTLWVKGSGDPYLVSEELELIARNLKQRGLQRVDVIGLDTSYFEQGLVMPGTGRSNNPYDAVPSALAANFNTVNIKKVNGKVVSAESQTPLTAYAKGMSKRFKKGSLRVNTGRNPRDAEKYFAELLAAFLRKQGVQTGYQIVRGQAPHTPFYRHENSKTVGEMVRPMMKFSTNFIANQLVLKLSAEQFRRPANAADVQRYMEDSLRQRFNWSNFTMQDGAGLSRANRLSPRQLVELLGAFHRWKHLLPEIEPGVYAKSGTLNKVSTLAGFIRKDNHWSPFALMMNQAVPYKLRNRIARELAIR